MINSRWTINNIPSEWSEEKTKGNLRSWRKNGMTDLQRRFLVLTLDMVRRCATGTANGSFFPPLLLFLLPDETSLSSESFTWALVDDTLSLSDHRKDVCQNGFYSVNSMLNMKKERRRGKSGRGWEDIQKDETGKQNKKKRGERLGLWRKFRALYRHHEGRKFSCVENCFMAWFDWIK